MQASVRKRVAIVVPRFGRDVRGGAEKLARDFAGHLSEEYEIDVITTCARDYRTWKNEFTAGISADESYRILRFEVSQARNTRSFEKLSESIRERLSLLPPAEQEQWIRAQGPMSASLLDYLVKNAHRYHAVFFMPYLYATSYFGLPLVGSRSILVPLAHDEWMLRLPVMSTLFDKATATIYVTEEERDCVRARFGTQAQDGQVCYPGVEGYPGNEERFRKRFGLWGPFALYVGRIDESKGCGQLVEDFSAMRALGKGPQKLVLAGPVHGRIGRHRDVVATGELDDQAKWDALAACEFFVMPSAFESFSFALLEAWTCAKPVLVNARSTVLVGHCRRSNGGLWYANAAEFAGAVDALDFGVGARLGIQGRTYVANNFTWARATAILRSVIEAMPEAG